jgi:hypothetical protein
MVNNSFTGTHSGFGWMRGDGAVRKNADPHASITPKGTYDNAARSFNLARRYQAGLIRLETKVAKNDGIARLGFALDMCPMGFAVPDSLRL